MQSTGFRSPKFRAVRRGGGGAGVDKRKLEHFGHFVCEIDFMVKLLRACVWMPWHKQAMKDAVSCDKPREDANSL